MFSSFFASKKWALWAYGGFLCLVLSLVYQTHINVEINNWYKEFYDLAQNAIIYDSQKAQTSLDECTKTNGESNKKCQTIAKELSLYQAYETCQKDANLTGTLAQCEPQKQAIIDDKVQNFWYQIWRFLYLAMPYVIIWTLTQYLASHWMFRWREAMTFSYIVIWRRHKSDIEGSSQRIQEDIYRFAKLMEEVGLEVLTAIMTLVAFLPILWALSDKIQIPFLKQIPGSLVWIALVVSIGGVVISWFVGIKLPKYEYDVQKTEAAFRKELVYAEDNKRDYGKIPTLKDLFEKMRAKYYNLFLHTGYFNIWLNSFSQFMVIVPYMVMGVGLFMGTITMGVLVQASNAFGNVRASFSVFTNKWTKITELRSIYRRLKEFEESIKYKESINLIKRQNLG